jgi:hypothetical protein
MATSSGLRSWSGSASKVPNEVDETLIRQLVRRKLLEGRLPKSRVIDFWDIPGDGQACDGCGEPMARNQTTRWGIAVRDWMSIQFHVTCFQIWEAERLALCRRESEERSGQS